MVTMSDFLWLDDKMVTYCLMIKNNRMHIILIVNVQRMCGNIEMFPSEVNTCCSHYDVVG